MPKFDIPAMVAATEKAPTWLHVGAGNIFRVMLAGMAQELLNAGHTNIGIIAYEAYDEHIVPQSFIPYDNLTLGVILNPNGEVDKKVIASISRAFSNDVAELKKVVAMPSLQMISFTITENGYKVGKICESPLKAVTAIEQVTVGLLSRYENGGKPLSLVSMDNFAENGEQVKKAVTTIAMEWHKNGHVLAQFVEYVNGLAYPSTMIDKITPRPSSDVVELLKADGFEDTNIHQTPKHTYVAAFVNTEPSQYLIVEDNFPNGRPPLENAGAYIVDKDTVHKMDQMKVCACLNPLHTILGVAGMLLNIPTIAECMKDARLVKLLNVAAEEALPTVAHPGIIDPKDFLHEVLTRRFPNPFIPDTPARIACDTSQKIPVRFGVAMQYRKENGLPIENLEAVPLFIALWLRYRMGKDDEGNVLELSPDPLVPSSLKMLDGLMFGGKVDLKPVLSDASIFGVDLYEVGLAYKVESLFYELSVGTGAVGRKLDEI